MLCMLSSAKLDFVFSLDQPELEVLDGLRASFIQKYGEEVYTQATMIIIKEDNFFNIIKNIYGVPFIGQHNDLLEEVVFKHLSV